MIGTEAFFTQQNCPGTKNHLVRLESERRAQHTHRNRVVVVVMTGVKDENYTGGKADIVGYPETVERFHMGRVPRLITRTSG